jgi:hypothetical protein
MEKTRNVYKIWSGNMKRRYLGRTSARLIVNIKKDLQMNMALRRRKNRKEMIRISGNFSNQSSENLLS